MKKTRKVSVIIFYDEKKRILLQDRTCIKKFGEDIDWGFFGGGIEGDETPKEALIREVKEELGIDLKKFKYIGKYEGSIKECNLNIILYAFISPLGNNLSLFRQKEGVGMKLFSLDEAEGLKIPERDKMLIRDLKKKIVI